MSAAVRLSAGQGPPRHAAAPARSTVDLLFIMEKVLGHTTHIDNLRKAVEVVEAGEGVRSHWGEVTYWKEGGLLERKWVPWPIKGAFRGVLQARASYGGLEPAAQLAMFAIASLLPDKMHRFPTVLTNDLTPLQLDRMGKVYGHRPDTRGLKAQMKLAWMRRVFGQAAGFSVWSEWVKGSLVEDYGIDAGCIEVIPPGVDIGAFPCPDRTARERKAPLKVLFVGGHFARKGGELLIDAFRALRRGARRVELHLVTRDPVPAEDGLRVHRDLKPNDPALLALLGDADIFCLPTLGDAYSMASIEAMAAGLPVIATRVGGIPDIVQHGETGFLLEPGDRAGLERALDVLAADEGLRLSMGRAGRRRCKERFDHFVNAKRQIALLRAAAGRSGRRIR